MTTLTILPDGLDYMNNFINEQEELDLAKFIDLQSWNTALKRRTQHYGHLYRFAGESADTTSGIYKYVNSTSDQKQTVPPVPEIFLELYKRITLARKITPIDLSKLQVIVNEYLPGSGISPHIDDNHQFGSWVCGISLLSNCEMTFSRGHDIDILLERRSLYIMTEESRYKYTHCIKPRKSDKGIPRNRRISITFRYVV